MGMWHIQWLDETPSTQTTLKKEWTPSNPFLAHATLNQTHGRGRKNNVWESPKNNLALSVSFPVDHLNRAYSVNILCAYSLILTLEKWVQNHQFKIKWPNDVWWNNKKISGLMSEWLSDQRTVVLGVGLNFNTSIQDFSPSLQSQITTLKTLLGKELPAEDFCRDFLTDLHKILEVFNRQGLEPFLQSIDNKLLFKNQNVALTEGEKIVAQGQFLGIDSDASALISCTQQIQRYISGDMSLRGVL